MCFGLEFFFISGGLMQVLFFFQFWEWFIQLRSPSDVIKYHPDFFKMEMCVFMTSALTLIHGNIY